MATHRIYDRTNHVLTLIFIFKQTKHVYENFTFPVKVYEIEHGGRRIYRRAWEILQVPFLYYRYSNQKNINFHSFDPQLLVTLKLFLYLKTKNTVFSFLDCPVGLMLSSPDCYKVVNSIPSQNTLRT